MPSAIGPQQSYGEFEHGALARAGDSKHGFRFAVRQLKTNVLEHHFFIEGDGDVLKFNGVGLRGQRQSQSDFRWEEWELASLTCNRKSRKSIW